MSVRAVRAPVRVWCVFGTRPEVVKMAPVVWALERRAGGEAQGIVPVQVFAGQHRELATGLMGELGLRPSVTLDLMNDDQQLREYGARCLQALGDRMAQERPDLVLVQGDTSTVLFASLAAYFQRVPVGHVEAGLRSFDPYAPFPEEMMRRLTDRVAAFHFAPTVGAAENLLREGSDPGGIHVTGNPVVDAVQAVAAEARERASPEIRRWAAVEGPFVVVTLHRRESFGGGLRRVAEAIRSYAEESPTVRFIYPVHPNPAVRREVEPVLAGLDRVKLIPPVSYLDMVHLLDRCRTVLTDSGGIQEEAPALGKRVLVARDVTERPEGVEAGWASLVGTDPDRIVCALRHAVEHTQADGFAPGREDHGPVAEGAKHGRDLPYGDGRAGERIADIVTSCLLGYPRTMADWRDAPSAPNRWYFSIGSSRSRRP
ncbi:MAG: non-hydrolyzing UDP-N-acetylglucosamine 2-epimerase [Gemmatimonadota bacterium]